MIEFTPFPKVPRLSRDVVITEKIDGTNASIWIEQVSGPQNAFAIGDGEDCFMATKDGFYYAIAAASRSRFLTPGKNTDNFGFAGWVRDNVGDLVNLGPGVHYGEWWGKGIQRNYGLDEKRFSLFNVGRWLDANETIRGMMVNMSLVEVLSMTIAPKCCHVVPVLWKGDMFEELGDPWGHFIPAPHCNLSCLRETGSHAAPGFMNPEGIMIYHTAANQYFKKTFENDKDGKWVR